LCRLEGVRGQIGSHFYSGVIMAKRRINVQNIGRLYKNVYKMIS